MGLCVWVISLGKCAGLGVLGVFVRLPTSFWVVLWWLVIRVHKSRCTCFMLARAQNVSYCSKNRWAHAHGLLVWGNILVGGYWESLFGSQPHFGLFSGLCPPTQPRQNSILHPKNPFLGIYFVYKFAGGSLYMYVTHSHHNCRCQGGRIVFPRSSPPQPRTVRPFLTVNQNPS